MGQTLITLIFMKLISNIFLMLVFDIPLFFSILKLNKNKSGIWQKLYFYPYSFYLPDKYLNYQDNFERKNSFLR